MPRVSRNKSKSGIYHIIMRGINRQTIFEDDEDRIKFINILEKYKRISEFDLYAYCLMGNHLHMLLREGKEPLAKVMRRICGSYVYWYNRKYERIGYLFQGRYGSEVVEDDSYFLTVIRYIFQNPIKAGLVAEEEEYKWSNFYEYLSTSKEDEVGFVLNMFSKDRNRAVKKFIEHVSKSNEDTCLDIEKRCQVTDKDAGLIIKNLCKIDNPTDYQKLDRNTRDAFLRELKGKHRLSIRQIERLTGINRGVISKA